MLKKIAKLRKKVWRFYYSTKLAFIIDHQIRKCIDQWIKSCSVTSDKLREQIRTNIVKRMRDIDLIVHPELEKSKKKGLFTLRFEQMLEFEKPKPLTKENVEPYVLLWAKLQDYPGCFSRWRKKRNLLKIVRVVFNVNDWTANRENGYLWNARETTRKIVEGKFIFRGIPAKPSRQPKKGNRKLKGAI